LTLDSGSNTVEPFGLNGELDCFFLVYVHILIHLCCRAWCVDLGSETTKAMLMTHKQAHKWNPRPTGGTQLTHAGACKCHVPPICSWPSAKPRNDVSFLWSVTIIAVVTKNTEACYWPTARFPHSLIEGTKSCTGNLHSRPSGEGKTTLLGAARRWVLERERERERESNCIHPLITVLSLRLSRFPFFPFFVRILSFSFYVFLLRSKNHQNTVLIKLYRGPNMLVSLR